LQGSAIGHQTGGILKVGIGLEGEDRDLKVLGVGNW
jgi:hypothetical protein